MPVIGAAPLGLDMLPGGGGDGPGGGEPGCQGCQGGRLSGEGHPAQILLHCPFQKAGFEDKQGSGYP